MKSILIVLSAADHWTRADGSLYETGVWAEEFIVIDEAFHQAGFRVDLATPGGVTPTIDALSLSPDLIGEDTAGRYRGYLDLNAGRLTSPFVLADIDPLAYDAIVIPGGHGPVEDLWKDADMGRVLVEADRAGKLIGSVCHGPVALLAANEDGRWPFEGRRMTAFTDEEEIEFGTAENAPWLLARNLRERGAVFDQGSNWGVFVIEDGNLITGQNPASSAAVAKAVITALES
ncbi:type 1 glutamine amidotransferase domain-containing protein [Ancylobacter oerskovii]|uniref:Type 1 glutamine amidotransferase domain-containing protein n=1 Tax=Ancylobacter oerskovii TaxID=459519 RepID=A0ABW4Z505_9HYPH|nr:type 1 glutamine amidotransferase domain-containing protein [Ancylobacter oerskovii]MBS7542447.1 type 1 glutamine amidotransferase domain-containing protein [Ancylobacter oerskovii]